jgi:hypothetical protein
LLCDGTQGKALDSDAMVFHSAQVGTSFVGAVAICVGLIQPYFYLKFPHFSKSSVTIFSGDFIDIDCLEGDQIREKPTGVKEREDLPSPQ